jgi:RNA polymerase sigma factor (TIGR02999 family)
MRRILIDNARRKRSAKAGGGWHRIELIDQGLAVDTSGDDLFAVDEALTLFAAKHPRQAQLVHLRFFLGMTVREAASYLGVAEKTAERDWDYACVRLRVDLDRNA